MDHMHIGKVFGTDPRWIVFPAPPSLILGGDLNHTLGSSKIWGDKARLEPLGDYFNEFFQYMDLVEIGKSHDTSGIEKQKNGKGGDI